MSARTTASGWVGDSVPAVDVDVPDDAPEPQDRTVDRRWVLHRAAWLSTAAAAGTLLVNQPAAAATEPPAPTFRDPAADGKIGGWSHPSAWAPFTFVGDVR